jgi:signal transduction histidine kinase
MACGRRTWRGIWEPFYTTKRSGIGLGLPVSHRIIREHGGTVEAQSVAGKGSTFTLRFPPQP